MLKLSLFGNPCLTDRANRVIYLNNSKEMAILVFLERQPDRRGSRSSIADLLWSDVEKNRQLASLRQAVKNLRDLERRIGLDFLEITRMTLQLKRGVIRSDVDEINEALSKGAKHGVAKANRLIASTFLAGLDKLDRNFLSWKQGEAKVIRNRLLQRAASRLADVKNALDYRYAPLARLMLKIDPAYEWAHQRLIQYYLAIGQQNRARFQFEACQKELSRISGSDPSPETKRLLEEGTVAQLGVGTNSANLDPPPVNRADIFPIIDIYRPQQEGNPVTATSSLLSEFAEQIGRNRELVVRFDSAKTGGRNVSNEPVGLEDQAGGQFLLKINETGDGRDAYVQLQSRRDGQSVFFDALKFNNNSNYDERVTQIGNSIQAMQKNVRDYHRKSSFLTDSIYGKMSRIHEYISQFNFDSNKEALKLLDGIEARAASSSQFFAYKSILYLQQHSFINTAMDPDLLNAEAKAMATKAIEIDPWHELNHRYLSFANLYSDQHEEAKAQILTGRYLSPSDASQTIAAAEMCALAGDIEQAFDLCREALRLSGTLPRYSFGYQSVIQFAAGNFDDAASLALQASTDSMDYRAIRVAALWALGQTEMAKTEMAASLNILARRQVDSATFSKSRICNWLCSLNRFSAPEIRGTYVDGIRNAMNSL